MADITATYDAKRRVISVLGEEQTIFFRANFEPSNNTSRADVESLDGTNQQSTLNYIRYIGQYSTAIIPTEDYAQFEEFMASVSGGEPFTITDPEDSDRIMDVKMIGDFTKARAGDKDFNIFKYSFSVVEQI